MSARPSAVQGDIVRNQQSQMSNVSIGIAANNKDVGSDMLMVVPIEAMQMTDGEIASQLRDEQSQGQDASGETYQHTIKTDLAIPCKWYPISNTNRRSAPDVRRGERVQIFTFGDSNEYHWQSLGMDDHLRKLETLIMSWSGTADESVDGTKPENSYFFEVSTHNGTVTFQTSQQNGEFSSYAVQIDAKNGKVMVADALGNKFMIDSKETVIEATNADNTTVRLDKQTILAKAQQTITLQAQQSISLEAEQEVKIKTKTFTVNADQTKFSKDIEVGGTSKFSGHMTASGITSDETIEGPSDSI